MRPKARTRFPRYPWLWAALQLRRSLMVELSSIVLGDLLFQSFGSAVQWMSRGKKKLKKNPVSCMWLPRGKCGQQCYIGMKYCTILFSLHAPSDHVPHTHTHSALFVQKKELHFSLCLLRFLTQLANLECLTSDLFPNCCQTTDEALFFLNSRSSLTLPWCKLSLPLCSWVCKHVRGPCYSMYAHRHKTSGWQIIMHEEKLWRGHMRGRIKRHSPTSMVQNILEWGNNSQGWQIKVKIWEPRTS